MLFSAGKYDTVLVFGATMPHEVAGLPAAQNISFRRGGGPSINAHDALAGALARSKM